MADDISRVAAFKDRIPRFFSSIVQIVEAHEIRALVEPAIDEDGDDVISVTWEGTETQFRATGLIKRNFAFPAKRRDYSDYLIGGTLWRIGPDAFRLQYEDAMPASVAPHPQCAAIDVITYQHNVWYHGPEPDLLSLGFITPRRVPQKRRVQPNTHPDTTPDWLSIRMPDQTILCWLESATAFESRMEERKREEEERWERRRQTQNPPSSASTPFVSGAPQISRLAFNGVKDYRKFLMQAFYEAGNFWLDSYASCRQRDCTYRLPADTVGELREALVEIYWIIDGAEIRTLRHDTRSNEEKAAARELTARAQTDPLFQRFLKNVQGGVAP